MFRASAAQQVVPKASKLEMRVEGSTAIKFEVEGLRARGFRVQEFSWVAEASDPRGLGTKLLGFTLRFWAEGLRV